MGVELIPADIHARFLIEERRHACAILAADFPSEETKRGQNYFQVRYATENSSDPFFALDSNPLAA
jgi:hypothetical protein